MVMGATLDNRFLHLKMERLFEIYTPLRRQDNSAENFIWVFTHPGPSPNTDVPNHTARITIMHHCPKQFRVFVCDKSMHTA